jgi:hypothetical protein
LHTGEILTIFVAPSIKALRPRNILVVCAFFASLFLDHDLDGKPLHSDYSPSTISVTHTWWAGAEGQRTEAVQISSHCALCSLISRTRFPLLLFATFASITVKHKYPTLILPPVYSFILYQFVPLSGGNSPRSPPAFL